MSTRPAPSPARAIGRRQFSLLAVGGAGLALGLSACTRNSSDDKGSTSSRLDSIKKAKKLTVGTTLKFEPQMFRDAAGKPAGYDIDLVQQMADDLGVTLDVQDQEFEGLIPGLLAGQFDLISVGLVNTPARATSVWFSQPYVPYQQVLLGQAALPTTTSIADLDVAGTVVTALTGSTAAALAKQQFPKATVTELAQDASLLEVSSGRAQAAVVEQYIAGPYLKQHPEVHLLNNGTPFATQYGAYALPAGDETWKNWVDNWVEYWKAQGLMDAKYRQWIEPTL